MAILVRESEVSEQSRRRPVFMAAVLHGQSPRVAWGEYERMLIQEADLRRLVLLMTRREETRQMLEESRRVWRERGLDAPFDFLFDDSGKF